MKRTAAHPAARDSIACGLAWISPWLIGFAVFVAVPIVLSGALSFCEFDGIRRPVFIGLEHWRGLFADPLVWKVLRNTAVYAALALPIGTGLGVALALLLNQPIPGQTLWRSIVFAPSLLPLVAVGIIWTWMFNARFGLINSALGLVGISGPTWLNDASWAMPSVVILGLWSIGHTVVVYLAGLQDVPRELYEASHLDGAGPWSRLWHVTLPMISPAMFFNIVIGLIFVWQIFAAPYVMFPGGGPERNAYFYTMYVYDQAFAYRRFGYACALSWVQLAIILALTAVAFRSSRHWVHYRGA
jgi:multiple sugar transport system permease protein